MTAMLLALFLYLLLSRLRPEQHELFACRGCRDLVHFDGRTFVHVGGDVVADNDPIERVDPLDDSSAVLAHPATPVGYPEERVA